MTARIRLILLVLAAGVFVFYAFSNSGSGRNAIAALRAAVSACASTESDRARNILCIRERLKSAVERFGVRDAMTALEKEFTPSGSIGGGIARCHDVAHAIGELGGMSGKPLEETLASCSSLCTYGCYHGAVEGYLSAGGDFTSGISSFCASPQPHAAKSACFHGLGHGAAYVAQYKLESALGLCDKVSGYQNQVDCGAGVFMELYEPSSFLHELLPFPENIGGFCASLGKPYREVCYNTAGVHEYGRKQNGDEALRVCAAIPVEYRKNCFTALGQNMYFVFNGSADEIRSFCANAKEKASCLSGFLEASVASDPAARHGFELCAPGSDLGNGCYSVLGEKIFQKDGPEKRRELCAPLKGALGRLCLGTE